MMGESEGAQTGERRVGAGERTQAGEQAQVMGMLKELMLSMKMYEDSECNGYTQYITICFITFHVFCLGAIIGLVPGRILNV